MRSLTKNLNLLKKVDKFKTVFLGIGTNKGNREKNISLATTLLKENKQIKILKVSKMLKNPPQEGIRSGYFLNGAIKILTSLTPRELLYYLKRIERKLGRRTMSRRTGEPESLRKKKPRTIDLDILFYGNEVINTAELIIPHPMLHKRYFVLIPLLEIGKYIVHPVYKKTVEELYLESNEKLKRYA